MNKKRTSRTDEACRRQARKTTEHSLMKKVMLVLMAAIILAGCTAGFGKGQVNAQGSGTVSEQTEQTYEQVKYYKSIQIMPGDSLWSIAEENRDAHHASIKDYIDEIKQINSLSSDQIHSGQYLTIVYYK